MSDGPHRSLNMRRGWKRLSERADDRAFEPEEVREALPTALEQDWHAEIPQNLCRQIRTIMYDPQSSFFPDQKVERLEALRDGRVVHPFGSVFLDCSIHEVTRGLTGEEAVRAAGAGALLDRATRGARQVEEHYRRKSTSNRALDVRGRIEDGISRSNFSALVARLIGTENAEDSLTSGKRTGLDDGVRIK